MEKISTGTSLLVSNNYQKCKKDVPLEVEFIEGIGSAAPSYHIKNENSVSIEDNKEEHCAYRAVWRATITQAVIDATSQSNKTADIVERNVVLSWLSLKSSGFLTVCSLADLNPEFVLERVKLAIKHPEKWKKYSKSNHKAKQQVDKLNKFLFDNANN